MNELPDDLVITPQPLIGLIGCQSLHFYVDQYLSTKHLLDFERVHPITPSTTTSPVLSPNRGSGGLDSPLVLGNRNSGNFSSSPSIDPLSILNSNNSPSNLSNQLSELTIQQQQQSQSQQQSQQQHQAPVEVNGWKVQSINAPIFKVISLEAGSLSMTKKEKRLESNNNTSPQNNNNSNNNNNPNGIIKANWIHKHTFSIPSVVSLFIQWPDDKSQKSHDQVLSQIDLVKSNIKSRNIKLILIIVTSINLDHDEKVITIKKRADIDPKYFLFLNKQDIKPFVKRWERLALELSDQYYKEMCQSTKSQISKTSHPFLTIRYNFKIAFYSEFRNDTASSLKYYKDSYNLLKDYKPIGGDVRGIKFSEIRSLASFFNLKICKISMWNNYIQDSLSHFERHIKLYKIYMGPAEKEFTHCIWLAKEYQIFAELLTMCPAANKSNFITNPGFYYQISARHLGNRRDCFKALSDHYKTTSNVLKYRDIKPRYDLSNLVYIGQPPPDKNHPLDTHGHVESYEELLLVADDDDLCKSIAIELTLNYTNLIIDTLNKAYDQSTVSGNHRILSYIESLIAYEYFTSKQYDLALKYYNKNAFTYRREKWTTLLTHSLSMLLKSVHHLNLPTNYIGYALDYLSPELNNSLQDRTNIQNSIIQILTPPGQNNGSGVDSPNSYGGALNKLSPPLTLSSTLDINMDHTHPLLDCRVQFPSSFTFTNCTTEFYVVIGSHFPSAIRFSSLRVEFSEKSYNKSIKDATPIYKPLTPLLSTIKKDDQSRQDLIFLPDESRLFTFKLTTKEKMELECKSVILELGTINFLWNVQEWAIKSDEDNEKDDNENDKLNTVKQQQTTATTTKKSTTTPTTTTPTQTPTTKLNPYKKFLERSSIRILDHESLIMIKCNHNSPAILNEFYEIELEIVNNDKEIKKGSITLEINGSAGNEFKSIYLESGGSNNTGGNGGNGNTDKQQLELPSINEGKSFKKKFYIHSTTIDESKLTISISYETTTGEISHTSKLFSIPVLVGFITQFQFFNEHFQQITDLYDQGVPTREALLLQSEIRSNLPYNVIIEKTSLSISTFAESARNATLLSPNVGTGGTSGSNVPGASVVNGVVLAVNGGNRDSGSISGGISGLQDSDSAAIGGGIGNMPVAQLLSNSNKPLSGVQLSKDTNYSSWFNLIPLIISESISFGSFIIEWKRIGSDCTNISMLPIPLPYIRTTTNPFLASIHVPSFGVVGQPLVQTIIIQNNTNFLQEFDLLVVNPPSYGNSDIPFFFSGDKQSTFSIHPDSTHEIKHILLPLVAGKLNLPHFKIISKRFNKELTKTKNTNNFIFVKPNLNWVNQ